MATYELIALNETTKKLLAPTSADTGRVVGDLSIALGTSLALTSGNVGIGIAHGSADGKLHIVDGSAGAVTAVITTLVVESSGTGGISILTPDASLGYLIFGSPSDNQGANLIWDYTGSALYVGSAKVGASLVLRGGNNNDIVTISGASGSELTAITGTATTTKGMTTWNATAIPAGGTAGSGYKFSSTSNFGVFFGSGAPSLSAAKGSLYLRSDGSGVADRGYINTDGGTTWTAIATAG